MGNQVLPAAFGQLFSTTSPNTNDQTNNDNRMSFVSAPKNVKFIIPLTRSGADSNENTFSVIESTTRTITHVKDIFPFQPVVQSSVNTHPSSTTVVNIEDDEQQNDMNKDDCEELPLLFHEDSKDK